jgi:hypothetical protein
MLNWPPGGDRLWLVTRSDGGSTVDRRFGLEDEVLAATLGMSIARISQVEHGDVTSFEVIARSVEAPGGRLDLTLVADFGDRTVRLSVSDTAHAA